MPNIAVIIVNWNGKKDTLECLASLRQVKSQSFGKAQDDPERSRMGQKSKVKSIIVDNGSTDGSVPVIRKRFPEVEIVETGKNLGFTGGNNVGIRRALAGGADYLWLLNNDTTVHPATLSALIAAFQDTRVGIAGSKIYFTPGYEFHKKRYGKAELGKVIWYAGGLIDWGNMYASHRGVDEVDSGQYDRMEETPFVTGCSMMVRKEVFDKIGFLDEKFFAYLEDLDFCLRAKQVGYTLLYEPQSKLWHKNAGSSSVGSGLHQYYMTRNRLLIGMRYAPLRTKIALLKEGVRFTAIRRRAYLDALLGRYGKQNI
ncbi:glycosyltransferase family 2 protein [Candidatus Gottesmanbacteria bacterium]|nr:glycosyltransferase family 2 protein [Candidatus Gottesmanbacteria bacterium]